jgi:hypothetical protein
MNYYIASDWPIGLWNWMCEWTLKKSCQIMSHLHERFKVHNCRKLSRKVSLTSKPQCWKTHVLTMLLETASVKCTLESANQFKCWLVLLNDWRQKRNNTLNLAPKMPKMLQSFYVPKGPRDPKVPRAQNTQKPQKAQKTQIAQML